MYIKMYSYYEDYVSKRENIGDGIKNIAKNIPAELRGSIDSSFLRTQELQDHLKNIERLFEYYQKKASNYEGFQELENLDSQLFGLIMHYLRKGAQVPFAEYGHIKQDLPIFDFSNEKQRPYSYHRSSGSTIDVISNQLMSKAVKKPKRARIVPVDSKNVFQVINNIEYDSKEIMTLELYGKKEEWLEKIKKQIIDNPEGFIHFISFSNLIDKELDFNAQKNQAKDIQNIIMREVINKKEIKEKLGENYKEKIIIGGFLLAKKSKLISQDYLYLGEVSDKNLDYIKKSLGFTGYITDIVKINYSLLNFGNDSQNVLQDILKFTPFYEEPQAERLREPIIYKEDINVLSENINNEIKVLDTIKSTKDKSINLHFNILVNLLRALMSMIDDYEPVIPYCRNVLAESMMIVNYYLKKITAENNLYEARRFFELVVEEIIIILNLISKISENSKLLQQEIAKKDGTVVDLYQKAYVTNSGMKAYQHIIHALQKHMMSLDNQKIKLAYSSDIYFEGKTIFSKYKNNIDLIEIDSKELEVNKINYSADAYFIDVHPNDARADSIIKHDIATFAKNLLEKREVDGLFSSITFVIDSTMHHYNDQDIQNILNSMAEEISRGKVNIVITQSMAKYAAFGTDKYTAGIIRVYNNDNNFSEFNDYLNEKTDEEPLSKEADLFLSFLLRNTGNLIYDYLSIIRGNTKYLYENLIRIQNIMQENQASQNITKEMKKYFEGLRIAESKDPENSYIGIFYDKYLNHYIVPEEADERNISRLMHQNFNKLLIAYIYLMSMAKELPLDMRMSFGFAHTNLGDCYTTIRITPGLESEEILDEYIKIIQHVNSQLSTVRKPEYLEKLRSVLMKGNPLKVKELFFPEIMPSQAEMQVIKDRYDDIKQWSLMDFIEFILNKLGIGSV